MNVDNIFYKTLVMHISQGVLAAQDRDNRFINTPGKSKESHFADQVFAYANEVMKRFDELDKKNGN
jgi:hypothetical protein